MILNVDTAFLLCGLEMIPRMQHSTLFAIIFKPSVTYTPGRFSCFFKKEIIQIDMKSLFFHTQGLQI